MMIMMKTLEFAIESVSSGRGCKADPPFSRICSSGQTRPLSLLLPPPSLPVVRIDGRQRLKRRSFSGSSSYSKGYDNSVAAPRRLRGGRPRSRATGIAGRRTQRSCLHKLRRAARSLSMICSPLPFGEEEVSMRVGFSAPKGRRSMEGSHGKVQFGTTRSS
jgi:hypothetical protein